MRGISLVLLMLAGVPAAAQTTSPAPLTAAGLQEWITAFRPKALAEGITVQVFDSAMAGVTFAPKVVERDRNQSEFTKTIWDYLATAVSDDRVRNGKAALKREQNALGALWRACQHPDRNLGSGKRLWHVPRQ